NCHAARCGNFHLGGLTAFKAYKILMKWFKRSLPFQFVLFLLLSLFLVLCAHLGLLYTRELPLFGNLLPWSYGINFLLAAVIFFPLYFFRERFKYQIGFLYLA